MENSVQIQISPEQLQDNALILKKANKKNHSTELEFPFFYIRKRSIDARKKPVIYNLQVVLAKSDIQLPMPKRNFGNVQSLFTAF